MQKVEKNKKEQKDKKEQKNTKANKEKIGTLYIVGTPIGNLNDITLRAIKTLEEVDIILAEDTRNTLKLLSHFNIQKQVISYHRHNEIKKIEEVLEYLNGGKNIALVSDAGMPIVSDPGKPLIEQLLKENYNIEVIPGVTAITTALVKTCIDTSRFCFEGFLSMNKKQRTNRLQEIKDEKQTHIFYEAPHKLLNTLKDMYKIFGNRKITIARELTKIYEEFIHTTLEDAIIFLEENGIKGEIVVIVEGQKQEVITDVNYTNEQIIQLIKGYINNGYSKKDAIKEVAKECKINKNEVYKLSIEL